MTRQASRRGETLSNEDIQALLQGPKKAPKFGNKKTEYQGIVFDSKAEATRYQLLQDDVAKGRITNLRRQVTFPLNVGGFPLGTWTADFVYDLLDGSTVVEDQKGVRTPVFNLKARIFYALYRKQIQCVDSKGKKTLVPHVPKPRKGAK